MITVRRHAERHRYRSRKQQAWHTFDRREAPTADGFGVLRQFTDVVLLPGAVLSRGIRVDAEYITHVRIGALAYSDASGGSGLVSAGEFQCRVGARSVQHREANASSIPTHMIQMRLAAAAPDQVPHQQVQRYSAAERSGALVAVASEDGRQGSLKLSQDVVIWSAIMASGLHLVHELLSGRSAWLHMVSGHASMGDMVLESGDGVGVSAERAVSITAGEDSEILLIDLGVEPAGGCIQ